jgi:hypothetical protein
VSQNFLFPQRDQPLPLPAVMREWLPEDDLVHVVLDAVASLDLGGFRRRYRADGHGQGTSEAGQPEADEQHNVSLAAPAAAPRPCRP